MFKVNTNLSPHLMNDFLRRNDTFSIRQVSSVYHGTKPLLFLSSKIWELVPSEIKQSESLKIFKRRIKNGPLLNVPVDCARSIFLGQDLYKNVLLLLGYFQICFYAFCVCVCVCFMLIGVDINQHRKSLRSASLLIFFHYYFVVYIFYCILFANNK